MQRLFLLYFPLNFYVCFLLKENEKFYNLDFKEQELMFKEINFDFKDSDYFDGFQQLFEKQYNNSDEVQYRFEVFKDNVNHYKEFNKSVSSFKIGINSFSDLSSKEFANKYLMSENFKNFMQNYLNEKNDQKKTKERRLFENDYDNFFDGWNNNFKDDFFHDFQHKKQKQKKVKKKQQTLHDIEQQINKYHYFIDEYPKYLNWAEKGIVTDIQHQLDCACCYAFSALAALESQIQMQQQKNYNFSEQEILDCTDDFKNQGCKGGLPSFVYQYIQQKGITKELDYKYKGEKQKCKKTKKMKEHKFSNLKYINLDNHVLALIAALQYGPVAVSHQVTTNFVGYTEGIIDETACTQDEKIPNHSTLLVGYNLDHQIPYFILKNSWGKDWGQKGYFKLKIGPLKQSNQGICLLARYKINSIPILNVSDNQLIFYEIIKQ